MPRCIKVPDLADDVNLGIASKVPSAESPLRRPIQASGGPSRQSPSPVLVRREAWGRIASALQRLTPTSTL